MRELFRQVFETAPPSGRQIMTAAVVGSALLLYGRGHSAAISSVKLKLRRQKMMPPIGMLALLIVAIPPAAASQSLETFQTRCAKKTTIYNREGLKIAEGTDDYCLGFLEGTATAMQHAKLICPGYPLDGSLLLSVFNTYVNDQKPKDTDVAEILTTAYGRAWPCKNGGDRMAGIGEELKLARQAKAVIEAKPRKETLAVLRKANILAAAQMTTFSSAGPLNDARHKLGLALPPVMQAQPSQDKIDNAKAAIEAWINELEAAKP
jgi:hypothetical protein